MRPDTVELLWELWQRSPLLGTFTVPVFTTVSTAGYRGSSWLAPRLYNGTIGARGEAGCSEHVRRCPCSPATSDARVHSQSWKIRKFLDGQVVYAVRPEIASPASPAHG